LIVEQEIRFVKQAPDQCGLAMIDGAAGDEPQKAPPVLLMRLMIAREYALFRLRGHQK
jgi:hypothetical protein